jgi:excisionase family DNA binding protein
LDKKQAAERLGLGLRRTLDLAHNKALKTEKVRDPVTHQWTVRFHAADIERYLELRKTPAEAGPQLQAVMVRGPLQLGLPPIARAAVQDGLRPSPEAQAALERIPVKTVVEEPRGIDPEYLAKLLAKYTAELPTKFFEASRISEKPYLTIEEAAEYSGLPKSYLLAAIHDKRLAAVKAGRWCINRKSLEAL